MKWFTYFNAEQPNAWGRRWSCSTSSAGLLFGSDETGVEFDDGDIERIINDELLRSYVGPNFVVDYSPDRSEIYVTHLGLATVHPDQAPIGHQILCVRDGRIHPYDLHQHYNKCRSLLKAVGCGRCPEHPCWQRPLAEARSFCLGDLKNKWAHKSVEIAGFTYASPVMTKQEHFEPAGRGLNEHDFSKIEEWGEIRSAASTEAALSRRFKRTCCSVCVLKGCSRYRYCDGPLYTEQQAIHHYNEKVLPDLYAQNPWLQPWQLWELVRGATKYGEWRAPSGRYRNALLQGPEFKWRRHGLELEIGVLYRCRPITQAATLEGPGTYELLAEVFGLPTSRRATDYRPEIPSPLGIALWIESLYHDDCTQVSWYGVRPWVAARRLDPYDKLKVTFRTENSLKYPWTMTTFSDIDSYLGVLELPRQFDYDRTTGQKTDILP